jgi:hypothetical protein
VAVPACQAQGQRQGWAAGQAAGGCTAARLGWSAGTPAALALVHAAPEHICSIALAARGAASQSRNQGRTEDQSKASATALVECHRCGWRESLQQACSWCAAPVGVVACCHTLHRWCSPTCCVCRYVYELLRSGSMNRLLSLTACKPRGVHDLHRAGVGGSVKHGTEQYQHCLWCMARSR